MPLSLEPVRGYSAAGGGAGGDGGPAGGSPSSGSPSSGSPSSGPPPGPALRRRTARAPKVTPARRSTTRMMITGVGKNEPPEPESETIGLLALTLMIAAVIASWQLPYSL